MIYNKLYIKWFQILETFYSSVTLILATAKCTMNQWNDARDKCKYRHKWGKSGPSYLINKNGDLFFYCIFRNRYWKEIVKESLKNCAITYLSKELSLIVSGSSEQRLISLYKNYTKKTNVCYFFTTQREKKSFSSDSLKAITWTFFRKEFKEYDHRDCIGHRFIFLHYIYVKTRIFSILRHPRDDTQVLIYKSCPD